MAPSYAASKKEDDASRKEFVGQMSGIGSKVYKMDPLQAIYTERTHWRITHTPQLL